MRATSWALLLAVFGLVGCDEGPRCPVEGEPGLEIGQGETAFAPIDGTFVSETGPQGGAHVWVALRAWGIWPGAGDTEPPFVSALVLADETGERWGALFGNHAVPFTGEGPYERAGLQVRLEYGLGMGHGVKAPPLTLHVSLTDACDTSLEGSAALLVSDP